jgi:hypothetical protein
MEEKPFTPNMDKLKAELGKTPPNFPVPSSSPADYAPKPKPAANKAPMPYQLAEAEVSQQIKAAIRAASGWHLLNFGQQEALDLIATDISRVCAGRYGQWEEIINWAMIGKEASNA